MLEAFKSPTSSIGPFICLRVCVKYTESSFEECILLGKYAETMVKSNGTSVEIAISGRSDEMFNASTGFERRNPFDALERIRIMRYNCQAFKDVYIYDSRMVKFRILIFFLPLVLDFIRYILIG